MRRNFTLKANKNTLVNLTFHNRSNKDITAIFASYMYPTNRLGIKFKTSLNADFTAVLYAPFRNQLAIFLELPIPYANNLPVWGGPESLGIY
jgi:hypothetical protein